MLATKGFGQMFMKKSDTVKESSIREGSRTFIELGGGDKAVIDSDGTMTIQVTAPHGKEMVVLSKSQVSMIKNNLSKPAKKLSLGGSEFMNVDQDKTLTIVSKAPHGTETVILDTKQVTKLFSNLNESVSMKEVESGLESLVSSNKNELGGMDVYSIDKNYAKIHNVRGRNGKVKILLTRFFMKYFEEVEYETPDKETVILRYK